MKADILLMPYSLNKVLTNSSGSSSNTAKYASPIKMFEYLASGRPILSSNLRVLKEILIDTMKSDSITSVKLAADR